MVFLLLAAAASCEGGDRRAAGEARERAESARESAAIMSREGERCDLQSRPDRRPCREACSRGHSNSCARLGSYWARGEGGAASRERARELYREGCEGGSGLGCAGLARRETGDEAARLWKRARRFCRVHCEQGHPRSCAALGRMFAEGRGGAADRGAARHYLQRACELGAGAACRSLGDL